MTNDPNKPKTFAALFRNGLVTGLFIVVPITVTLWLAWWGISLLTDWALEFILNYLPQLTFPGWGITVRILTIILLVAGVFLVGILARITFGRKLIQTAQRLLLRIPLLSIVYSTCEQIGETVKTQQGGLFKSAVMFEYPQPGCWAVGFITSCNETPCEITKEIGKEVYSIFMPTTPNPTSGFLMFIPKEKCIILKMSVGEAMRLIVSGGVILPETKQPQP